MIALAHPALKNYLADAHAQALAALAKKENAEFVLATATAIGKDLFPRLAARLGAPMASEIISIGDDHTFVRPTYAGNVMATVELDGPIKVLTVRGTAFDAAKPGDAVAPVEKQNAEIDAGALKMEFVSFNATKSDRPQLTEARIIVSGGRGLKSGENFKTVLEPLVDEMGAAMGAVARGGRCGLRAERPASRADRQGGRAGTLHRGRDFRRDSASGGNEGLEGHLRDQQG